MALIAPSRPGQVRRADIRLDDHDHAPWATIIALTGLTVGVLLAVLGTPPLDLHPPPHQFGIMDPLCGGTRALQFTMLGQWGDAWRYNPLSPILAAGAVVAILRYMAGTLTGRWLTIRLPLWMVFIVAVAMLVPLEINQQLHATLLQGR